MSKQHVFKRIRCPNCDLTFGQEKRFLQHHREVHGSEADEELYVNVVLGGEHKLCGCGCGSRVAWKGWKLGYTSEYLRGHNAVRDSVFTDPERMKGFVEKRVRGYREGRYHAWNKGKTKETCEVLRQAADKKSLTLREGYASGKHVPWQQGKTKETCDSLRKASETHRARYASGEIVPWSKGLTKGTSAKLAAIALRISESERLTGFNARRYTEQQLRALIDEIPGFTLLTDPGEYRNKHQKLEFRCKTCGKVQLKNIVMLRNTPVCFNCHPQESMGQLEVLNFVKSLAPDAISNDRSVIAPMELDVWIPSRRLAIEYNGLYWHSDVVIGDDAHHERKRLTASQASVSLLTIYEDEWRDRRSIVEGMIRHRLHASREVYDARKLELRELSVAERREFFLSSHLEGDTRATGAFGLVSGSGRVLAALSLRRPFHRRYADHLEVARSACLPDHVVRGWLGRLTKAAKEFARQKGKVGLITYVDSRVGHGGAYKKAGWEVLKGSTGPRFWWTDFVNRFNRFACKADKSRGMTQAQVSEEMGLVKIWGCSNALLHHAL